MKDPAFAMALLTQVRPVTRNDLVSKVAADWQELDTAAHYAVIHFPHQRTMGPAVCS